MVPGGKLTTDGSGNVSCAADSGGGGGSEINWTRGCIALSDEDIKRIYRSIGVGSRIKIFAKSIR